MFGGQCLSSSYHLLYTLNIIEFLLEQEDSSEEFITFINLDEKPDDKNKKKLAPENAPTKQVRFKIDEVN